MRLKMMLGLLLTFCLWGCWPITNERGVYGSYVLEVQGANVMLDVLDDHSYTEVIRFSNGSEQRNSDKWHWKAEYGYVCFNAFLLPRSFKSDVYEGSHPLPKPTVVGDAYTEDRCMGAGKVYGKTILEIDPDGGQNFVKIVSKP